MAEEFLTPKEVAEILKVSPEWVYKHAKEYGGIKIGRLVRFSKRLFNKIIEEVISGSLPASQQLDVRLCEKCEEIPGGRIPDPPRSSGSRSQGKDNSAKDKYGLLKALHFPPGRSGDKKE